MEVKYFFLLLDKFMNSLRILVLLPFAHAVSVDCLDVISLAFGLKVSIKNPTLWTQLQGDCCIASGVYCDGSQRVWQIDWNNNGLNGVINGTAIPSM